MRLHLEGFGLMGALIGHQLAQRDIDFTWSEKYDEVYCAWPLSTGAILPFGDSESWENLTLWSRMVPEDPWLEKFIRPARYCYVSEKPPHGGAKYGVESLHNVGPLHISNMLSWHMDVQRFVRATRKLYRECERPAVPEGANVTLVTHGFGRNIHKWSWGWSAKVRIAWDRKVVEACAPHIPMLYGRRGYQLPYLYPVGTQPQLYYAGTTLITQSTPKQLEVQRHYETWEQHITEYTEGLVGVVRRGELLQGWRPMAHPDDALLEYRQGKWWLRPQYGNGLRMFPTTFEQLIETLEVAA